MRDAEINGNEAFRLPRDPASDNETASERFDFEEGAVSPSPELVRDSCSSPLVDGAAATMTMLETTKGADGKRRPAGLELIGGADSPIVPSVQFDENISQKVIHEKGQAETNSSHLAFDDESSTSAPVDRDSSLQCTAVRNPRFLNYQSRGEDVTRSNMAAVRSSPGV